MPPLSLVDRAHHDLARIDALVRARPTVDCGPPKALPRPPRPAAAERARRDAQVVAAVNDINMIGNIAKEMARPPSLSVLERKGPTSLNTNVRRKELSRIDKENERLLKKLETAKSSYNKKGQAQAYEDSRRHVAIACAAQQARSGSEQPHSLPPLPNRQRSSTPQASSRRSTPRAASQGASPVMHSKSLEAEDTDAVVDEAEYSGTHSQGSARASPGPAKRLEAAPRGARPRVPSSSHVQEEVLKSRGPSPVPTAASPVPNHDKVSLPRLPQSRGPSSSPAPRSRARVPGTGARSASAEGNNPGSPVRKAGIGISPSSPALLGAKGRVDGEAPRGARAAVQRSDSARPVRRPQSPPRPSGAPAAGAPRSRPAGVAAASLRRPDPTPAAEMSETTASSTEQAPIISGSSDSPMALPQEAVVAERSEPASAPSSPTKAAAASALETASPASSPTKAAAASALEPASPASSPTKAAAASASDELAASSNALAPAPQIVACRERDEDAATDCGPGDVPGSPLSEALEFEEEQGLTAVQPHADSADFEEEDFHPKHSEAAPEACERPKEAAAAAAPVAQTGAAPAEAKKEEEEEEDEAYSDDEEFYDEEEFDAESGDESKGDTLKSKGRSDQDDSDNDEDEAAGASASVAGRAPDSPQSVRSARSKTARSAASETARSALGETARSATCLSETARSARSETARSAMSGNNSNNSNNNNNESKAGVPERDQARLERSASFADRSDAQSDAGSDVPIDAGASLDISFNDGGDAVSVRSGTGGGASDDEDED
eukprot:CAMPEP_0115105388 /NCGR_PEP_ID=MMETSP0227-20121206/35964_1 /TAXON_ID=89957 /ORGANISM="Polarella glacialis, Strain CCMP 1383" /LENGTH=784 /DNA_ID=CAMNT_0002502653 /DNA_START=18 /DNA_END=2372 /DNA_ORIENTATION=+